MATKRFVDTNILLRYVLKDDNPLYEDAKRQLENTEDNSLILTAVVVAEVIYILRQHGYDRPTIADTLLFLTELPSIYIEDGESMTAAIKVFKDRALDFVDCYI